VKGFHIPLAHRKGLCARLLFFDAAYPDRLKFLRAGAESEFDQLRDNLFRLTEQSVASSPNSVPLDVFLQALLGDLHQQMGPHLKGKYGSLFQPLHKDLERGIYAISCSQCSPISPRICDGGTKDDEIVGAGGSCIAQMRSMFDLAARSACDNYSLLCNLFPRNAIPKLTFASSFTNGKPHDIPGDYFVGAVTTHQSQPSAVAEVELCVWPRRFDFNSYAATLYVLFHECICHAYQDMLPLRSTPLKDGFIEGWMDWIAFECFRRQLQPDPFFGAFLDAGTAFHLLRGDYNHKDRSDQASVCAFGRSIAKRLEQLLVRLPESGSDPWARLLMLSFDLNVSGGLSDNELAILDDLLPQGQMDPPVLEMLIDPVRKYLISREIGDFLSLFT
jgi:hypothetical protein